MKYKVAILDMNNATPNQGMRCIKEMVGARAHELSYDVFDVRAACEVPGTDYDIYISSGGPGSPLDGDGVWDHKYFSLIEELWAYNEDPRNLAKKYVFFICHSFQMACNFFKFGHISERPNTSFGILPMYKTPDAGTEQLLSNLPDPFYAVDVRKWQVTDPNASHTIAKNARVLSLERPANNPSGKRALMAVRFSEEFIGTQFHPEADPIGMLLHFQNEERKEQTITAYGEEAYIEMIQHLSDPDKISLTHSSILPSFLYDAVHKLNQTG